MPKFNPYPILDTEQYRRPSFDETVNRPIQQGLESLVQFQEQKRKLEQDEFDRGLKFATLRGEYGQEGVDSFLDDFQPKSKPLQMFSGRERFVGPSVPRTAESAENFPGDFQRQYGTKGLKIFQEQKDRLMQQKLLESNLDLKNVQAQKILQDIESKRFERNQDQMKEESNRIRAISKASNINSTVNRALEQVGVTTSGFGSIASRRIPGTSFANLRSTLNTIKANLAFETLQEMREASKTGGALGQVSERELTLLESALAALDQDQSPEQLRENLLGVQTHYNNVVRNLSKIQQRGDTPISNQGVSQGSQSGYIQTATNPQTGEKIGTRDGVNWEPMQ